MLRYLRVPRGEALDVDLVDDRPVEGRARRLVVAPIELRIDHDPLGNAGGVVNLIDRQVGVLVAERVAEDRLLPVDDPSDRLRIRIEQDLVRVEAETVLGIVRAGDR